MPQKGFVMVNYPEPGALAPPCQDLLSSGDLLMSLLVSTLMSPHVRYGCCPLTQAGLTSPIVLMGPTVNLW